MSKRNGPEDDLKPIGGFLAKFRRRFEAELRDAAEEATEPYVPHPPPPRWAGLGIPKAYHGAKLGDFTGLAFSAPESLFVFGPNGTGKTHLAAALAMEWHAPWVEVFPLLVRIKSTFSGRSDETERSILAELVRAQALVLDDLWSGNKSDFAFSWLMGVLNLRINDGRSTVVTSDKGLAEIRKADSSLASRLSGFRIVKLGGKDRRVRGT